jgi:hypothetical protein
MGKSDDDLADIQDAPTKLLLFVPFIWMRQKSPAVPKVCRWVKIQLCMRLAILADFNGLKPGDGKGKMQEA